jgi:hypothetical protein
MLLVFVQASPMKRTASGRRRQRYGRGVRAISLTSHPEEPAIRKDRLPWVSHWGSLGEEVHRAIPPRSPGASPRDLVVVHTHDDLVIAATTGEHGFNDL